MYVACSTLCFSRLTLDDALQAIREHVLLLVREQYRVLHDELTPRLRAENIRFLRPQEWTVRQKEWLHRHFRNELMPVLSPLGLDPVHPFPRILTKSLN